jgi:hypothetical protein
MDAFIPDKDVLLVIIVHGDGWEAGGHLRFSRIQAAS